MLAKLNKVWLRSSSSLQKGRVLISTRGRLGLAMVPVVMLLLFSLVSPVAAEPPTRETVPFDEPITIPGELACGFDVMIEPLTNEEKLTTFFDQEGNVRFQLVTGGLKVQLTNLSTGKSVEVNISGPYQFVPQPDGSLRIINWGATLYFFEPNVAPDLPLLTLIHGRVVAEFDAEGNFHLLSVQGHVDDVCALLAGD